MMEKENPLCVHDRRIHPVVVPRSVKAVLVLFALGVLLTWSPALAQDSECVKCHTDAEKLKALAGGRPAGPPPPLPGPGLGRPLEPQSPWERVLISPQVMEDENHGSLGCEECHGGDPAAPDFETAHKDVVLDPSFPAPGVCADCHDQDNYEKSLHYSLSGMMVPGHIRAGEAMKGRMDEAFQNHCASCHASCGQCHLSRPASVGGGLTDGHKFLKTPDLEQNCAACHGARVGDEYLGRHAGYEPDFHFADADMNCSDCHQSAEMHGDAEKPASCLDCHAGIYEKDAENAKVHNMHQGKASCQVCHAQAYLNCTGCHLDRGQGGFTLDGHNLAFKIGYNPAPDERRPEKFVLVRRVPVEPDTFKDYVGGDLAYFRELPNWKPSAPHNVVRQTEQNKSCNNCHGNWNLFLLRKDVEPRYVKANRAVIVPPGKIPQKIKE
ncbi:MAG: hypothetical protein AB1896_10515 [Thermodesulfobacteriota bacterium]